MIENTTQLLEVRMSTDLTYNFKLGDKPEKYKQQVELGKHYKNGVVEEYKDNKVYLSIK